MESLFSFALTMADLVPLANWDHDDGPGWWIVFWPLMWVLVIGGLIYLFRVRGWGRGPGFYARERHESGVEVLERRFAEGEIDAGQYRERRAVLEPDGEPGAN